jgi:hypothetical protein
VLDDPACRNLDDVVLSYTFFKCVFFRVLSLSLSSSLGCSYREATFQGETEFARPTGT